MTRKELETAVAEVLRNQGYDFAVIRLWIRMPLKDLKGIAISLGIDPEQPTKEITE